MQDQNPKGAGSIWNINSWHWLGKKVNDELKYLLMNQGEQKLY